MDLIRDMCAIGIERRQAVRAARDHPGWMIRGWLTYAAEQENLHNPAGFVLSRIKKGDEPPDTLPF